MLALLLLVLLSFGVTIWLMHEKTLPDEYAKWAQGWTAGILTSLTLAMNRSAEKPHALAPGTTEATLRVQPPIPAGSVPVLSVTQKPEEKPAEKAVDPGTPLKGQ